jgi:hypothetical protein
MSIWDQRLIIMEQGVQACVLDHEDEYDAEDAGSPDPAVPHDSEPGLPVPAAHDPVDAVGQTIDVEGAGDDHGQDEQKYVGDHVREDPEQGLVRVHQNEPDDKAHKGEIDHGPRQVILIHLVLLPDGEDRQELERCDEAMQHWLTSNASQQTLE